jgi:hypothetical protein
LVLKPGQRYFLDRHIDEQRKLLFSTYNVDDNKEVKEAIKNNGKVKVEFYQEYTYSNNWGSTGIWVQPYYNQPYYNYGSVTIKPAVYYTNTGGSFSGLSCSLSGSSTTFTTGGTTLNNVSSFVNATSDTLSIETGRVEKGDTSNQSFGSDYGNYSSWVSYTSEYQILPRSVKPIEVSEIREYCPGCGTRMKKKTWKFCPNCGESLD